MSLTKTQSSLPFLLDGLKGLTQDSRHVQPGYLFAAFKGQESDGRDYIAQAIENGANIILTHAGSDIDVPGHVELILDENPRAVFAQALKAFYKYQPERIVAVTGTNGKTSVAYFVSALWQTLGFKSASLGTLGLKGAEGQSLGAGMTTPDAETLHHNLDALVAKDSVTHLVMESSSHGLDQCRMDGVNIQAAGFTNLSRDHLDYHKTEQAYFDAKARLFADLLPAEGTAILNADETHFESLKSITEKAGASIWSYGWAGQDLQILSCEAVPDGLKARVSVLGEEHQLHIPLVGAFQLDNILCALGLVMSEQGVEERVGELFKSIENMQTVPGRLQRVDGHPLKCGIYVDYAHTPDALETVLTSVRGHAQNNLICLFGCGGDRDKGKRPMMGEVASKLADKVIVTDDNPRSEDPAIIRKEIMSASPNALEIANRADAIHHAVGDLSKGDVLLVAGKGHEQGQVFADHTQPFDDVEEVQKSILNIQDLDRG